MVVTKWLLQNRGNCFLYVQSNFQLSVFIFREQSQFPFNLAGFQ
uniref:Uncharacterized protein n=1 Tax=Anguilla anguilla TaxID=7936 RepID=A0A0E9SMV9_ANGAN